MEEILFDTQVSSFGGRSVVFHWKKCLPWIHQRSIFVAIKWAKSRRTISWSESWTLRSFLLVHWFDYCFLWHLYLLKKRQWHSWLTKGERGSKETIGRGFEDEENRRKSQQNHHKYGPVRKCCRWISFQKERKVKWPTSIKQKRSMINVPISH